MKKYLLLIAFWGLVKTVIAQELSSFRVKYLVTYDESNKTYTAWVVPDYDTPNVHNPDTEEKGATAQFTLKVPAGFVLSNLKDIRGSWDKNPAKLGQESAFLKAGLSSNYEYYVIGKSANETNYGAFKRDEPVALFSFEGSSAAEHPEQVQVLDRNDPFIQIADKTLSLNVGNSFYSRSGQRPAASALPLEQFAQPTTLNLVLRDLAARLLQSEGVDVLPEERSLITYPSPATTLLTIKYFSEVNDAPVVFDLIDLKGTTLQKHRLQAKKGVNTLLLSIDKLSSGSYLIRTELNKRIITKKFVKVE
ncbi:T9SS type A sorting domain-containing protein [Runella salmonicolor]|uniref:T9SS type A sorting domain-containing protein n=1 Tax=Runella salmonicolor TaxID=2950278 RepID=A0ABT1FXV0_9BACT|nr:T9SS type A sorting domain-containing protein [Runella salmonicolor]MCP1386531.1 T9SS type A sorting domain-containing protein [Runella salmonicolor]